MSAFSTTVYWAIGKGVQTVTLSPNTISIGRGGTSTITASWIGDGTLSAVSSNTDIATVTVNGDTITVTGQAAGNVTITATVSSGTRYESGSATAVATVNAVSLAIPTQNGTLTYSGGAQSPTWNNYDSSQLTISGATSGTNAGTYNATFTPNAGYQWIDGTATAKQVPWTIDKANANVSISPNSLKVVIGATNTISVTRTGNGSISATSSNTGIATTSVSGTTVRVTGVASGTVTITVNVAETTNYASGIATAIAQSIGVPTPVGSILSLSVPRQQLVGASVGDYALAMGGFDSAVVDAYNSSLTRTIAPTLSVARGSLAGASTQSYGFAMGGLNVSNQVVATVDAYSEYLTRTTATALSEARSGLMGVSFAGYAVAVGGSVGAGSNSSGATATIETYNNSLTRSVLTTPLTTPRYEFAIAKVGNYMLAMGGAGLNYAPLNSVEVYDSNFTKSYALPLSASRFNVGGANVGNDYALAMGGDEGNNERSDVVDAYSNNLTKVTSVPKLYVARHSPMCVGTDNYAFAFGGEWYSSGYRFTSQVVDMYNPSLTRYWETLSLGRSRGATATVGNYALAMGGWIIYDNSGQESALVEGYTDG